VIILKYYSQRYSMTVVFYYRCCCSNKSRHLLCNWNI